MNEASHPVSSLTLTPRLPGDKSITHRALLLGSVSAGETRISNPNRGEDCRATQAAVQILGADVREEGETLVVDGVGGRYRAPEHDLDLGNSGTGLRLLAGLLAGQPFTSVLTGDASLRRRPVERILEPLRLMGAAAEAPGDQPPVRITGGPLTGIRYRLPVASAQVKSAVLLAGLFAEGTTIVEGGRATRDHTERMLPAFGVPVERRAAGVAVRGPAVPTASVVEVPGDPSAAMFYLAAALVVPESKISLEAVSLNPTRTAAFEVFNRMGLDLTRTPADSHGIEPRGQVDVRGKIGAGIDIGPEDIPGIIDELPAIAVAAAFARGKTRIRGAGELRVKESDRLETVGRGLHAIGARVRMGDDGWEIDGSAGSDLSGGEVVTEGDHRVAMAFLIAGLHCRKGVTLADEPGIATSDPYFLSNLKEAWLTDS